MGARLILAQLSSHKLPIFHKTHWYNFWGTAPFVVNGVKGVPNGNSQQNTAVVSFIVRGIDYSSIGPDITRYPNTVAQWGASYIELNRPIPVVTGTTLSVTVTILNIQPSQANDSVRVSALPIRNFGAVPHIANQFLQVEPSAALSAPYHLYVTNFELCDRVALIINGVNTSNLAYGYATYTYSYKAELTNQAPPSVVTRGARLC